MSLFLDEKTKEEKAIDWFFGDKEVCEAFKEEGVERIPWTTQRAYLAGWNECEKHVKESACVGWSDYEKRIVHLEGYIYIAREAWQACSIMKDKEIAVWEEVGRAHNGYMNILEAKIQSLESQLKERDERNKKLETALREILQFKGPEYIKSKDGKLVSLFWVANEALK